jgi:hypothetical protein
MFFGKGISEFVFPEENRFFFFGSLLSDPLFSFCYVSRVVESKEGAVERMLL